MSGRDAPTTPAERIEAIRQSIPPPAGRQARNAYISKDDFAELLGAGRSTIMNWLAGKSYPGERYRQRLADLSGGRFAPEDFDDPDGRAVHRSERRLEPRVAALEEQVERLARHILGEVEARER